MARRAGIPVDGAEHVASELPRSSRTLLVYADRVELVEGPDEPPVVVPRGSVERVEVEDGAGSLAAVTIQADGRTLTVTVQRTQATLLAGVLQTRAAPTAGAEPSSTDLDVLRQLKTMQDEGLITPEEYAAKKAEVLARM